MRHPRVWFAAAPPGGPRSNPVGYYRAGSGPGPVKRESGQMSRGAPTGAVFFFLPRLLGAPIPSFEGREKRRALPRPMPSRDQHSVGYASELLTRENVNAAATPE